MRRKNFVSRGWGKGQELLIPAVRFLFGDEVDEFARDEDLLDDALALDPLRDGIHPARSE